MYLKPSEIGYSQDSINNVFDKNCKHPYKLIGETLDELCDRRCSIESIPTISVVKRNNKWFTADNRRLWVFRNLERLGKCSEIYVNEGNYIPALKFTTFNDGESVIVRNGSPGGKWYKKSSEPKVNETVYRFDRNVAAQSNTRSCHLQIEEETKWFSADQQNREYDTDKKSGKVCINVVVFVLALVVVLLFFAYRRFSA